MNTLRTAIAALLRAAPDFPAGLTVIERAKGNLENDIAAALSTLGLAIWVMPILPRRAMQGVPFIFFEEAEVRLRLFEQPTLNATGIDIYGLIERASRTLHTANPDSLLHGPLSLASAPVEAQADEADLIAFDLIFTCAYQLPG